MSDRYRNAKSRANGYASKRGAALLRQLGAGFDGLVLETDRDSAIKSFQFEPLYQRERDVYLRLKEHQVFEVEGCRIPRILSFDDELWVVEMGIVQPPFIVDFAGASLDCQPEYPEDVYSEWLAEKEEQFEVDWPLVQSIMATLAGHGIFLTDVKPGNITFR